MFYDVAKVLQGSRHRRLRGRPVGRPLSGCTSSRQAGSAAVGAVDPVGDAIGRCAAATIGGAVVGTLIGAAAGGGRAAGAGALIGGAVGGVGCAVLTASMRRTRSASATRRSPRPRATSRATSATPATTARRARSRSGRRRPRRRPPRPVACAEPSTPRPRSAARGPPICRQLWSAAQTRGSGCRPDPGPRRPCPGCLDDRIATRTGARRFELPIPGTGDPDHLARNAAGAEVPLECGRVRVPRSRGRRRWDAR